MPKADIDAAFPNLASSDYTTTSPDDDGYNCFCWAIRQDKNDVWCSPTPIAGYYWPPGLARNATLITFIELYELEGGYVSCDNGTFEEGYEKIVLYVDATNEICHASRQLPSGKWTSKLGVLDDIEHDDPFVLEADYGPVLQFMKRPVPNAEATSS
jgi:hypothetical protein